MQYPELESVLREPLELPKHTKQHRKDKVEHVLKGRTLEEPFSRVLR